MSVVTRRSILSFVCSIFDPLGLISSIILCGKVIFQLTTRLKLAWDTPVPDPIHVKWLKWLNTLQELQYVKVPRCIKPDMFNDSYLEIPRLELHVQSALLSAKVSVTLVRELDISVIRMYYWTDSMIALAYIKNVSRKFKTFVENRVSSIRELTCTDDWHHIGSGENPADIISRGTTCELLNESMWLEGPAFLRTHKSELQLPMMTSDLQHDDPELKRRDIIHVCTVDATHPIEMLCQYHSNWYRLKKAMAWLIKIRDKLLSRPCHNQSITVSDMNTA